MRPSVLLVALALLLVPACGDDDDSGSGAPAPRPGLPLLDLDDVDPCTLLNRQQQEEIGDIDLTQPVVPSAGFEEGAACAYDHTDPSPRWQVVLSVDPAKVVQRPADSANEGLSGTAQPGGCVVRVDALGLESRYLSTDPVAAPTACPTAVRAAEIAGGTIIKRLPRESDQRRGG